MSFALRFFLCCKNTSDDTTTVKKSDKSESQNKSDEASKNEQLAKSNNKQETDNTSNLVANNQDQLRKELSVNDLTCVMGASQTGKDQSDIKSQLPKESYDNNTNNQPEREMNSFLGLNPENLEGIRASTATFHHDNSSSNANNTLDMSKTKNEEDKRMKIMKGGMVIHKIKRKEKEPGVSDSNPLAGLVQSNTSKHENSRSNMNSTPIMRSSTLRQ